MEYSYVIATQGCAFQLILRPTTTHVNSAADTSSFPNVLYRCLGSEAQTESRPRGACRYPLYQLGQTMLHHPCEQHVSLKAVSDGACGLGLTPVPTPAAP